MKLPNFAYSQPTSVGEAITLLAGANGGARLLAGGQSLVPILAFRLATPILLVDIGRIEGLDTIVIDYTGIHLGARVRWRDIETSGDLAAAHPLLAAAIAQVAHHSIRTRGTVGGSLAHADPAAEMPGIAVTCDADVTVVGPSGSRLVAAGGFFRGALTTVLASDEMITGVSLPPWPPGRRWGFREFARRQGDFALAGAAVFYDLDDSGRATNSHIGVIGVDDRPRRLTAAEAFLDGRMMTAETINAAAAMAARLVDPPDDIHGSARYRRALLSTLLERALTDASARG